LDWPGCVNVRDLGGLAAADGIVTVFRSIVRADNVRRLTARGWVEAREYGIRTVLDLRSDGERVDDASAPPDLHFAAVSLFDDFDSDAAYRAELERRLVGRDIREAYRLLYTEALDRNRAMFATALQVIANARQGGVLLHWAGAKTGRVSSRRFCYAWSASLSRPSRATTSEANIGSASRTARPSALSTR
jgi:protein-tyrosine phosphatase